jgi:hypothetical protein
VKRYEEALCTETGLYNTFLRKTIKVRMAEGLNVIAG